MPRRSNNQFTVENNVVYITRPDWDVVAQTTYRDDYYPELSTHTWSLKNGYPYNDSLGGGLHRYIMGKWYGADVLDAFTQKGYVVDHMNNNHADCRISNLEFLLKDYNTAKGQQLDKDTERLYTRIALTISKDFETQCYQITLGCNDPIALRSTDKTPEYIDCFKMLYEPNVPYIVIINDADNLLQVYEATGHIDIEHTHACQTRVYIAPNIQLSEDEKEAAVVMRGDIPFVVIGNGHTYMKHIAPDHDWHPPKATDAKIVIRRPTLIKSQ